MRTEIIIWGVGGEGIGWMGEILGASSSLEGKNAVQITSYGAEVRGTPSKSEIIISSEKINYPKVISADFLIALNAKALNSVKSYLKKESLIFLDESIVEFESEAKILKIPAKELAEKEFKSRLLSNLIMLGYFCKITKVVSEESIRKVIGEKSKGEFLKKNLEAFNLGFSL